MSQRAPISLAISLALLASAVIAYEIVLTRLFSFLLQYHYSFLIVSGAVFGLGLGALAVSRLGPHAAASRVAALAVATSATICLSGAFILHAPRSGVALLLVAAGVPLVAAGAYLALLFRTWGHDSQRLYFWDLSGAALGTAWIVPAMDLGPGALGLCAAVAAGAGVLAALTTPRRHLWLAASGTCMALALVAATLLDIDIDELAEAADKPMFRGLSARQHPGRIVETSWSAYARTDLVDRTGDTGLNLYLDGAAGSYLFRFDGDLRRLFFLRREAPCFPYYFGSRERVLVIGPGGGADVLFALLTGWQQIDGVEVNADAVRMVRSRPRYSGRLYDLANVEIHVGDGRAYLERSDDLYDLISLPLVYTEVADLVGYQLTENYLFTREAFARYFEHLTPGGRLSLVLHDHELMVRAVATLNDLWRQRGAVPGAVLDHLVVVNGSRASRNTGRVQRPVLLIQQTPYDPETLDTLLATADELELEVFFVPGIREPAPLGSLRSGELQAPGIDVTPATDDRPYFYDVTPGVDGKLLAALAAVATLTATLLAMGLRACKPIESEPGGQIFVALAAALGAGYMFIEIFLLQRLTLVLGHPILALVVTLFGLLLATGIGAVLGQRLPLTSSRGLGMALLGCALGAGLLPMAPGLLSQAQGWPLLGRCVASLCVVLPTGFLLGLPFPAALTQAKDAGEVAIPWMWTVNGAASVLGSLGAVVIGIAIGSMWIPVAGGVCYLLASTAVIRRREAVRSARSHTGSGSVVLVLALVIIAWLAVFQYTQTRYSSSPPAGSRPSPPSVPESVWPHALSR